MRLGFRQIDGFNWLDEDEERLKRSQLSFRMRALARQIHLSTNMRLDGFRARARRAPRNDKKEDWADRIVAARNRRPFTSLEDFARDTGLPKRALILLADADAFRSLGLDRREALWQVRRLPDDVPLPLFEAATAREQPDEARKTTAGDAARRAGGRRLPDHPPVAEGPSDGVPARDVFARARRRLQGGQPRATSAAASAAPAWCWCGSGRAAPSGVVFMTLEDETGIANVVVWPKIMEQYRKEVMGARLILVEGYIQSSPEKVTHLIAQRMIDRSHDLVGLAGDALEPQASGAGRRRCRSSRSTTDRRDLADMPAQKVRHPRNVRILPPSRDFH